MAPDDRPVQAEREMLRILRLPEPEQRRAAAQFCAEHPELADDLQRLLGQETTRPSWRASSASTRTRLARLAAWAPRTRERYTLRGEVARGGMGAILRAFDEDLGRTLAMKVVLGQQGDASGDTPAPDQTVLDRFLDEAQITGQLDHPGVVPVHELGVDERGCVFFTMRLVRGRTAEEVFRLARAGAGGSTMTSALEVILKVCDTLAYAHSKGVIHRDLKPSNVMVGQFGEVYVMDWGLAKVTGVDDRRDLRIRPPDAATPSQIRTDRSRESESDPDSPLVTMDGAVVGTPCYMSPEQAMGTVSQVDERSDVYAVGAMLYALLAGSPPYLRPGQQASPYTILRWVIDGPPTPLRAFDRRVSPELEAICERAMARSPQARYANAKELADDVRAYIEHRVVSAYRTGAIAELASWVRRNGGMAAGLMLAAFGLTIAIGHVLRADRSIEAVRSENAQQVQALREAAERQAMTGGQQMIQQMMWNVVPITLSKEGGESSRYFRLTISEKEAEQLVRSPFVEQQTPEFFKDLRKGLAK